MKYCTHCGKELLDEAVICLNCGCKSHVINTASQPTQTPAPKIFYEDTEPQLATWSKIAGITSFFIGWFALGITAVILAHLSKKETGGEMCPSAKVGFVCGIVSTALSFFAILSIVSLFGTLSSFLTY